MIVNGTTDKHACFAIESYTGVARSRTGCAHRDCKHMEVEGPPSAEADSAFSMPHSRVYGHCQGVGLVARCARIIESEAGGGHATHWLASPRSTIPEGAADMPLCICPRLLRATCECEELPRPPLQTRTSTRCEAYRMHREPRAEESIRRSTIAVKLPLRCKASDPPQTAPLEPYVIAAR